VDVDELATRNGQIATRKEKDRATTCIYHRRTVKCSFPDRLIIRHTSAQVIILANRVAEQVGRLIKLTRSTNALDKLFPYCQSPRKKRKRGNKKKLTVEIKLPSPVLSLELSHHIPPPRPWSLIYCVFCWIMAGVS